MKRHSFNTMPLYTMACFAACFSINTMAQEVSPISQDAGTDGSGIGLSLKAGTLGPGIELDYRVNKSFNVRLQANSFSYDDTFEEDGIDYTGELNLSTFGLLADWRPFSGTFRLSGGVYSNNNELKGSAVSNGAEVFEIGDLQYVGSQSNPLSLNTAVALGSGSAGYLGFGWGNSDPSGWMFSLELGVLFSGVPEVELTYSGTADLVGVQGASFDVNGNSAEAIAFRAEIDKEIVNLEEDISDFEAYPVIALSIGYRF